MILRHQVYLLSEQGWHWEMKRSNSKNASKCFFFHIESETKYDLATVCSFLAAANKCAYPLCLPLQP